MADTAFMEKLTALCKRRGFIFQSSEIYGGIGGFWDYGPMGVELKRNIKNAWWRDMVTNPPGGPDGREIEMVGVDCSIIMNPRVWEASGHVTGFADPMVDCRECQSRFRTDQVYVVHVYGAPKATLLAQTEIEGDEWDAERLKRESPAGTVAAPIVSDFDGKKYARFLSAPYAVLASMAVLTSNRSEAWTHSHSFAKRTIQKNNAVFAGFSFEPLEMVPMEERVCPSCQARGTLTEPRQFNLMFETYVGALKDESAKAWLRPETAQGIFANFKNVLDTSRVKLPFGIAQVGKAFRNEINPRNYTFRSREFEQMEIEFFCKDDQFCDRARGEVTAMEWYHFWRNTRYNWYVQLGLQSEKLRLRDQGRDELAHYSSACADIEYLFPFSDDFQELEGVAHRGCFDLTQHQQHSGKDMSYFDDERWERDRTERAASPWTKEEEKELKSKAPYRFVPTVIEPSAGADRATLAFLCEAYTEDQAPDDKGAMQTRVVMKFHPRLAPIKAAVFPLVNKEGMPDIAEKIYKALKPHMTVEIDTKGAIGRRYRRQDEIGTPFCITIDGDTLKDGTVTVRNRDTLVQERIGKDLLIEYLRDQLKG